jgi:hypothetical protein
MNWVFVNSILGLVSRYPFSLYTHKVRHGVGIKTAIFTSPMLITGIIHQCPFHRSDLLTNSKLREESALRSLSNSLLLVNFFFFCFFLSISLWSDHVSGGCLHSNQDEQAKCWMKWIFPEMLRLSSNIPLTCISRVFTLLDRILVCSTVRS